MAHSRTVDYLVEGIVDGKHAALARAITKIENKEDGHRDLVSRLYEHVGGADVIGITGSPGAGKSTLVDKVAKYYRDQGLTVGVIAIDPSSPFTGGAVLGDRIRMASTSTDMDVFFRSMTRQPRRPLHRDRGRRPRPRRVREGQDHRRDRRRGTERDRRREDRRHGRRPRPARVG